MTVDLAQADALLQRSGEQGDARVGRLGRPADDLQQILQVRFQIAVVGQARLRLEIQADLNVLILELEGADEARKPSESAPGEFDGRAAGGESQHRR
jgi:hypothetical protein